MVILSFVQPGRTLLHYAAYHGKNDVVDFLLASKADVDAVDMVTNSRIFLIST